MLVLISFLFSFFSTLSFSFAFFPFGLCSPDFCHFSYSLHVTPTFHVTLSFSCTFSALLSSFSFLQSLSAPQAQALSCVESLCCYQHGQSGCSRLAHLLEQMTGQCQDSANHCHTSSRSNRWGGRRQEMIMNPDEPSPPLGFKKFGLQS